MKPEIPLKGDECDAFMKRKQISDWGFGERKRIKNLYRRRVRRFVRLKIKENEYGV